MFMMLNNLDMSSKRESPSYIVNYFVRYGDEEMQEAIKKLADKYEWIKPVYESALKSKKEHEDFISRNSSAFVTTANVSRFVIDAPF
jgi:phosphoribosylamine-glycine ligase